mmetsp:Transcript_14334/g.42651  ORF Transcript_14334/g.42651 Transcript_14334/m.42651 type:complete len:253 (-) Transcript_14334:1005-1763(-)
MPRPLNLWRLLQSGPHAMAATRSRKRRGQTKGSARSAGRKSCTCAQCCHRHKSHSRCSTALSYGSASNALTLVGSGRQDSGRKPTRGAPRTARRQLPQAPRSVAASSPPKRRTPRGLRAKIRGAKHRPLCERDRCWRETEMSLRSLLGGSETERRRGTRNHCAAQRSAMKPPSERSTAVGGTAPAEDRRLATQEPAALRRQRIREALLIIWSLHGDSSPMLDELQWGGWARQGGATGPQRERSRRNQTSSSS